MSARTSNRRRWFQFSLRGLLLLVVLVALGAYACRSYIEPYRRQRDALKVIGELGGTMETSAPTAWQRWLFGDDFLNITLVDLAHCDDPEKVLTVVADLPHLEVLVVGGLSFQDEHLRRLHRLRSLRWLVLDSADVSPEAVAAFEAALPQAHVHRSFRRAWNVLSEKLEVFALVDSVDYLQMGRRLRQPDGIDADLAQRIDANHFSGGLESIHVEIPWNCPEAAVQVAVPWLRCLDTPSLQLTGRFTDAHLGGLGGLSRVQELDLADTDITDAGLIHISRLTGLRTLDISMTDVTSAGVQQLRSRRQLRELNLRGTKVTAAGLRDLRKALANCRIEASVRPPDLRQLLPAASAPSTKQ